MKEREKEAEADSRDRHKEKEELDALRKSEIFLPACSHNFQAYG